MILVTGATGNVGREAVRLLLDAGAKVVAVSRNPATAALPVGAQVTLGALAPAIVFAVLTVSYLTRPANRRAFQ
jgi:uncharacterized protein YbjT (DUF2867 family)